MSPSVKMSSVDLMRERDDVREYADCEKQFADGLKKRIAELEMVLDDERAHCEEFKAEADRALELAYELKAERDELIQRLTTEQIMNSELEHEAELAREECDKARTCAEEMRDLYAAEIDESIAAFPFPWEEDHDADRDGE